MKARRYNSFGDDNSVHRYTRSQWYNQREEKKRENVRFIRLFYYYYYFRNLLAIYVDMLVRQYIYTAHDALFIERQWHHDSDGAIW